MTEMRHGAASAATPAADPRPSGIVLAATYLTGAAGLAVGFGTVLSDPPSLSLACLLAVAASGILSFVRHSLMYRSDAARMGWDYGSRNNFQLEVGLANLAWGGVGLAAVMLGLGLLAEAVTFLTFGAYLSLVAAMMVVSPGGERRSPLPLAMIGLYGVMMLVVGGLGVAAV